VSRKSQPQFLRVIWSADGVSPTGGPGARPANTSFEEERREVLDSVLDAMAGNPPDPDEMAACRHLLQRLAETAGRHGRHSA
jgi:hypothetical protein